MIQERKDILVPLGKLSNSVALAASIEKHTNSNNAAVRTRHLVAILSKEQNSIQDAREQTHMAAALFKTTSSSSWPTGGSIIGISSPPPTHTCKDRTRVVLPNMNAIYNTRTASSQKRDESAGSGRAVGIAFAVAVTGMGAGGASSWKVDKSRQPNQTASTSNFDAKHIYGTATLSTTYLTYFVHLI